MKVRTKKKLVQGVGVNDADYPVYINASIADRWKTLWVCPFYRAWVSMLVRCYSPKFLPKNPTYIGCSVDAEWHSFMAFRAWMVKQDWEGKHLDKDILQPGNKIYSADSCVLVSKDLNTFFTDAGAARGEWPIGVSWHKRIGKFQAKGRNPFAGKEDNLGYFAEPGEAHEAWRAKKHEYACRYADIQTDPRIAQALRTRYANLED